MATFDMNKKQLTLLNELADLQHPHLKGDNHTRSLIKKVYNQEKLTIQEAFDCGKYYQRMLRQLDDLKNNENYGDYLHAVLTFKWNVK